METLDMTNLEMHGTRVPTFRPATVLGDVVSTPPVHGTVTSFVPADASRVWAGVCPNGGDAPKGPSAWSPPI